MASVIGTGSSTLTAVQTTLAGADVLAVGTGSTTLDAVAVSGAGDKANSGVGAVTLPHAVDSGTGFDPPPAGYHYGHASVSLKHVTVTASGVIGADHTGTASMTLRHVTVAAHGAVLASAGHGAVQVPMLRVVGVGLVSHSPTTGKVYAINETVRATGQCLLAFQGPFNTSILWSVLAGGGTIAPLTNYTDAAGLAYAIYHPNGYTGQVSIEVTYVP
jgi:hypothetical protein